MQGKLGQRGLTPSSTNSWTRVSGTAEPGKTTLVQRLEQQADGATGGAVHAAVANGISGTSQPLPRLDLSPKSAGVMSRATHAAREVDEDRAEPETATAPQWLGYYLKDLAPSIRYHLAGAQIPPGHPRLTWSITGGEVAAEVWDRLAPMDMGSSATLVRELERLLAPGLWKRIDEVRPIDPPELKTVGDPEGPYEYVPEAAIVLARDLEKVIASATTRLGPRIVAAMDVLPHLAPVCEARDASILPTNSVVQSHPFDAYVLEILGIPGTATVEPTPTDEFDPYMDHVARVGPSGLRPVAYEWVDAPSMWS
ncbi:MAG TPA: hypothetical protein VNO30_26060 [Kofleriaceae bacterium]|nr:hypothetical protein [Kofleriaceae bacterium]